MSRTELLVLRASELARAGRDEEALTFLRNAIVLARNESQHQDLGAWLERTESIASGAADLDSYAAGDGGAGASFALSDWAEALWAADNRIERLRNSPPSARGSAALAIALSARARAAARQSDFETAQNFSSEALSQWRTLLDQDQGHWPARMGRALSLHGAIESSLERHAQAEKFVAEACRLFRNLAQTERARFVAPWASAVHNLAGVRLLAGDHGGAVSAARTAIALRREAAANGVAMLRADLAATLTETSGIFCAAGLAEEALEACAEAVEILRALAVGEAQAVPLASALKSQARAAMACQRWDAGLAAIEEEIAHYRGQGGRASGADVALAEALHNRATFQTMLGDDARALASVAEAIRLRREQPSSAKARGDLGASLHLAGKLAVRGGDLEGSAAWLSEAATLRASLDRMDGEKVCEDVFQTNIELARVCARLGRLAEAAQASEAAAAALRGILDRKPGALSPYARALLQVGNLRRKLGAAEAAIAAYTQAARLGPRLRDAGAEEGVAIAAAQKLIVYLRRVGRASEAETWRRRLGVADQT